jgi:hypothetical protein
VPDEYPLRESVQSYLKDELGLGRLLDFGVILRLAQRLLPPDHQFRG